jgi:hypothetical protein
VADPGDIEPPIAKLNLPGAPSGWESFRGSIPQVRSIWTGFKIFQSAQWEVGVPGELSASTGPGLNTQASGVALVGGLAKRHRGAGLISIVRFFLHFLAPLTPNAATSVPTTFGDKHRWTDTQTGLGRIQDSLFPMATSHITGNKVSFR